MPNIIDFGKEKKIHIKRLIFLMVAIVFMFSLAIPVSAEPETVLTGCLNKHSGVLHKVALGLKPVSACSPAEVQVTWSSGVPDLEGRIVALEERIAGMESDLAPLDLTVHCPEESVGEALAQAGDRTAHVTITIIGVCTEEVVITRDNTTLQGASPGDGLQAPSPTSTVLGLQGRGIELYQLTLTGGGTGIHAIEAASFSASNVHISETNDGVYVAQNAVGNLYHSTVENTRIGVSATTGGVLRMFGGTIDTCTLHGAEAGFGGHIGLHDGTVVRNTGHVAVHAREGGSIDISDTTVEDSDLGVFAIAGGHITIDDGSIIQNNVRGGVAADGGGTVWLSGGSRVNNNGGGGVAAGESSCLLLAEVIIEHNGNDGISVGGGATARFGGGTIVQNNAGDGIELGVMSAAIFYDSTTQVIGNTGTAVRCSLASVAQMSGAPGIISGNGSDVIDCPQFFP